MIEDLIESGQYQHALSMLGDTNDEQVRYLRLVCLNALSEFEQAKQEGLIAKANAKETYYDVIAQYVHSLKELNDYESAIDILIEELSMPYIPYQYEMMFNAAYDEVLLEKREANFEVESKNQIFSIEEISQILKNKNCNEDLLYMALEQLQQLNVRMIIPVIQDYLMNQSHHFFAKTLLIEIMIEQQVDEDFEIDKFGHIYHVNPSYMPLVLQQEAYGGICKYLENGLEDENPSLFHQCVEYLEYTLYALYPKEIYEDEYNVKAASIHSYVSNLQGIEIDYDELELIYYCHRDLIEQEVLALKQIEC